MEKMLGFQDYLFVLREHFLKAANIMIIGIFISVYYAMSLPPTYQSTSVVQILQPTILAANSRNQTNTSAFHRLEVIKQQMMSRGSLENIIQKNGLYTGPENSSIADKISLFREATELVEIQSEALRWRADSMPTSLNITFKSASPVKAALIANELADELITLSREQNVTETQKALAFFESERTRVGNEISKLDAEISTFKQVNADQMPEGLTRLRQQLVLLDESVFQLESEIVSLKSTMANNLNPITSRKLGQLQRQHELAGTKRQILIKQLARGPEVERAFITLTRKLKQLSDQLGIINKNRSEAEMNEMIEASRQQSNFKILDRALEPKHPVSPNKKKIVAQGFILSFALTLALIIFLEYKNGFVRTSSQMKQQLDLEPVMIMPTLRKPRKFFARLKPDGFLFKGNTNQNPKSD